MQRIAYGKLQLSPAEFWALTPKEFALYVQGYQNRMDDEAHLIAWQTANLLNAWTEKTVQPKDLLRQIGRGGSRTMSKDEYEQMKEEHGWD